MAHILLFNVTMKNQCWKSKKRIEKINNNIKEEQGIWISMKMSLRSLKCLYRTSIK